MDQVQYSMTNYQIQFSMTNDQVQFLMINDQIQFSWKNSRNSIQQRGFDHSAESTPCNSSAFQSWDSKKNTDARGAGPK